MPHGRIWLFEAVFFSGKGLHGPGAEVVSCLFLSFRYHMSESVRDRCRVSGAIKHKVKAWAGPAPESPISDRVAFKEGRRSYNMSPENIGAAIAAMTSKGK